MKSWGLALVFSLALAATAAQVADMSGTWQLNVQKSSWGKHPTPTSGTVTIVHHEPSFQYSGKVTVDTGTETSPGSNTFTFQGAVDGKQYPVSGSAPGAKMSIRRIDERTIASELRAQNGGVVETAKTTISADGKRLTRDVKAAGPNGEVSWTEVYDRQ